MQIPVLTEPNFRSYFWAKQTLEGITQACVRKKYRLVSLDAETYETYDYDSLYGNDRRMIIVIGTSLSWMPKTLTFFSAKGIESVFISFDPAEPLLPAGMVRMDYVHATSHLLAYLESCGRRCTALYAINRNSSADTIKMRFFRNYMSAHGHDPESAIFYNNGSLCACYEDFRHRLAGFDSVICANDIAGISLLSFLKRDGIQVPDQMFLTAFGDSEISKKVSPSLTIATLDHRELGRQAVTLFAMLYRQPPTASMSVRVKSHLIVRESTGNMPDLSINSLPVYDRSAFESTNNFYSDPEAKLLLQAEALLNACDETDLRFLDLLLSGESLEWMEKQLFLTVSALQYRKKRLIHVAECTNTDDFLRFLRFCRDKGVL